MIPITEWGAVADGVTDATGAIQGVIDYTAERGLVMGVPAGDFAVYGTLRPRDGLKIRGVGWRRGPGANRGSRLIRKANVPMISAVGTSIKAGGPMLSCIEVSDLCIDGGGYSADLIRFECVYDSWFDRVHLRDAGRLFYGDEFFDSRFRDCRIMWGGTADGTVPAVELTSTMGREYTNQIHFANCVWESNRGVALAITGQNTNEIFLTDTKIENIESSHPAITAENAGGLSFNGVQIYSRGTGQIAAQIDLKNCRSILGRVFLEHGETGGQLDCYVRLENVTGAQIDMATYNSRSKVTTGHRAINCVGVTVNELNGTTA